MPVPVAVEILICLIVPAIVFMLSNVLRSRERMRVLQVVLASVQGGSPLSVEMVQALPGGNQVFPTPQRDFRLGVLLIAVGAAIVTIGICTFFAIFSEGGGPAIAVGVSIAAAGAIPACIGAALIILSRGDKRVVES
jgi:hypothetical protein